MAAKSGGKMIFEESCQKTADALRVKNFVKIGLSRFVSEIFVFAFKAEIQDGRQKWRENNFCKKLPTDSADTLRIKNFVKIALSRSVSEICVFCIFSVKKNHDI